MNEASSLAATSPSPAAHYTVVDLAGLLQCSDRHVWRLIDAGRIPGVIRLGRIVRLHRATIDQWLAAGCPRQFGR